VIEGLQARLRDSGRGIAGRGIAEQGLLFGRSLEGATEILDFQPASNRTVPEMMAALSTEPGKRVVVGYYRTEHGEMLRLNEDDLALFQMFFGKPSHVFLMIQPNAFAPPNATFFFAQGDHKMSEFPFLEFPLDASLLATEERDRISRCQQATEQPTAAPSATPAESGHVRAGGRDLLRVAAAILGAIFLLVLLWIGVPLLRERFSGGSATAKVQPAAQPAASPSSSYSSARIGPSAHIGLQARRQDRDLELTWDRDSPLIAAATSALVLIEDGAVKHKISLNAQQIRGESILYSPTSDQVLIQLTVTAPSGDATESVRVIQNQAIQNRAIQNQAIQTRSATVSKPLRPDRSRPGDAPEPHPAADLRQSAEPRQSPSENIRLVQASKPFTAPPATKSAALPTLNEPPTLPGTPDHSASPAAGLAVPHTLAPPRPIARPATPSTPVRDASNDVPAPPEASAGTTYHPPVPLTKVTPTFPPQLKSLVLKPTTVAVRVTIDKNGRVLKAEPLPQANIHKFFIVEAVHAAQLWKFQPARRGDDAVSSELVLQFAFKQ
jgi:TonB family protein